MLRNLPFVSTMIMQRITNFATMYYNNTTLYEWYITSGPGSSITAKIGNICNTANWASCPTTGARCPWGGHLAPMVMSNYFGSFHIKSTSVIHHTISDCHDIFH